MPCTTEPSRVTLPADITAPGRARDFLRSTCCATHTPTIVDEAELLVSELVTNAVRHGWPPIELQVQCAGPEALEIRVRDSDPVIPHPVAAAEDAEGGRGLMLVDLISERWGAETDSADGKTVWFTLRV